MPLETVNWKLKARNFKFKIGFTLIELLIAIALLGILSTIGIAGFQNSQKKTRDAQRKSDLAQVKRALENARNDCRAGSYYPMVTGTADYIRYKVLNDYLTGIDMPYLDQRIEDPIAELGTADNYRVAYSAPSPINVCPSYPDAIPGGYQGTRMYVLRAKLEIATDADSAKSYNRCKTAISLVTYVTFGSPQPSSGDGWYYECPD